MRMRIGRMVHDRRGASVAEMALLMPLLLLLAVGVADLGRAFHSYIVINNASREGARYASRFPWLAQETRDAAKREAANSGVTLADGDITIDPEPPAGAMPGDPGVQLPGFPITVVVDFPFDMILGGAVGLGPLTLHAETTMVVFGAD
jgi:Flp pilus assembly protein TadG